MSKKPTYEELELRLRKSDENASRLKQAEKSFKRNQLEFEAFFKKAPLVMFIVDKDRRLVRLNQAAVALTRRMESESVGLRGGDALRCINASNDPKGCGHSAACQSCIVRNTVLDTFLTGCDHRCVEAPIPYDSANGHVDLWVLVSTTLLKHPQGNRVLVCLEDITEHKRAEQALRQSYEKLELHQKISEIFLTDPKDQLFNGLLALLLDKFESRYGFIGYLDRAGNLVCPSMSVDIWKKCHIHEKKIVFPKSHWSGLWGESLLKKRSMMRNVGLDPPKGHVPLINAIVVPIVVGKKLIGQVAIANKPVDYTLNEQKQLESITEFIAPILQIYIEKEEAQNELRSYAGKLEEKNIALNVLLENREEAKKQLIDSILNNFERLVFPYYSKLKTCSNKDISTFLTIIKNNTKESLSMLEKSVSVTYRTFTPMEIQVADLIKAGKTSKQMSAILNISLRSVFFHRNNIRKKLNIKNQKTNLRSALMIQP